MINSRSRDAGSCKDGRSSGHGGALEGLRILVVDDAPDNQLLFSLHLTQRGADVTLAADGLEGAQAARGALAEGHPFDVVLLDMQMPVMDGYVAAAALRREGYGHPIVALTAHSSDADRTRCLDAGCDDFLTKPTPPDQLVEVVLRNLR